MLRMSRPSIGAISTQMMNNKMLDYQLCQTDTKNEHATRSDGFVLKKSEEERIWSLNLNHVSIGECKEILEWGV